MLYAPFLPIRTVLASMLEKDPYVRVSRSLLSNWCTEFKEKFYVAGEAPTKASANNLIATWWEARKNGGGRPQSMTPSQEAVLAAFCKVYCETMLPSMGEALMREDLLQMIDAFRRANGIGGDTPCSRSVLEGFLNRHKDITLKSGIWEDKKRWQACTRELFEEHFAKLNELLFDSTGSVKKSYKLILSVDETAVVGTNLVVKPNRRAFVAYKGTRSSVRLHSKLGNHMTMVGFADALGSNVPPMIIGTTTAKEDAGIPAAVFEDCNGSPIKLTSKGFMEGNLWWWTLKEYIPSRVPGGLKANVPHQVLVICDNPQTHNLTPDKLNILADMGIDYFTLPHNTSHYLQACDQEIFSVFKQKWKKELAAYMQMNRGDAPGKWEVLGLLQDCYDKAFEKKHILGSFKTAGIVLSDLASCKEAQEACIRRMDTDVGSVLVAPAAAASRDMSTSMSALKNAVEVTKEAFNDRLKQKEKYTKQVMLTKKKIKASKNLHGVSGHVNSPGAIARFQQEEKADKEREEALRIARKDRLKELEEEICRLSSTLEEDSQYHELMVLLKEGDKDQKKEYGKDLTIRRAEMKRKTGEMEAFKKKCHRIDGGDQGAQVLNPRANEVVAIVSVGPPAARPIEDLRADQPWNSLAERVLKNQSTSMSCSPANVPATDTIVRYLVDKMNVHLSQGAAWCVSYVWDFVRDNIHAAVFLLSRLQLLELDSSKVLPNGCFLRGVDNFAEINEDTPVLLQGGYLYFEKARQQWIRSGKVSGDKRGVIERGKEHADCAKDIFGQKQKGNRLYEAFYMTKWDTDLIKVCGVNWTLADQAEVGDLFHWSRKTICGLNRSTKTPAGHDWTYHKPSMVAYMFEAVLSFALDGEFRISDGPGFETYHSFHCKD